MMNIWTWQINEHGDWFAQSSEPLPSEPTIDDLYDRSDFAISYTPAQFVEYKLREYKDSDTPFVVRYWPEQL